MAIARSPACDSDIPLGFAARSTRVRALIPPTWQDLFGRTIGWATIGDAIRAAHDENAFAMAYLTIYAAREGNEDDAPGDAI